ncbi:MAG: TA system VapC family ribonuclease toxin [Betaproteobacteria bacterium]
MRALLDINVLIALLDQAHPHHETASSWLTANIKQGWASCPITQNGCVRIMSQPSYPGARPVAQIVERLRGGLRHAAHRFWPDDLSIVDDNAIDTTRVHGARQVTDTYLLALALKHGGRLVTFDSGIALAAVRGATARHLVTLA